MTGDRRQVNVGALFELPIGIERVGVLGDLAGLGFEQRRVGRVAQGGKDNAPANIPPGWGNSEGGSLISSLGALKEIRPGVSKLSFQENLETCFRLDGGQFYESGRRCRRAEIVKGGCGRLDGAQTDCSSRVSTEFDAMIIPADASLRLVGALPSLYALAVPGSN